MPLITNTVITSDNVKSARVNISDNIVNVDGTKISIERETKEIEFNTQIKPNKVGLMVVGLGGNNGTTLVGGILAHKNNLSWKTKKGIVSPDWKGSIMLAGTSYIGKTKSGDDYYVPNSSIINIAHPIDWIISGWDLSADSLGDAMNKSKVFDVTLQDKLYPIMNEIKPLPGIYFPDFIASNQKERCNNVLKGSHKELLKQIQKDINEFKSKNLVDLVIVLWTASTERCVEIIPNINDTADNLIHSINNDSLNSSEYISPSTIYAIVRS